jgi:hypothetical protein
MSGAACAFVIEVHRANGALVGFARASASTCVEDAWFRGVQAGRLPNGGELPVLRVAPTWHDAQRPAITGLSIALDGGPSRHYPREVFWPQARALIQRLLDQGRIATGEKVEWSVIAREEPSDVPRDAAHVKRAPFPLELLALPHVGVGEYQICIDAQMLRRLRDRIRSSGSVEGAELLVGRLWHDASREALELHVVDALAVKAGRGGRSNTHFSFDPAETLAARCRARERTDGVLVCGWHHNHPPCEGCWKAPECKVDSVFFSEDDVQVQTTMFASPQMVALVGGKLGALPSTRPGFRLYGWRNGCMVERSFRVVGRGTESWDPERRTFAETFIAQGDAP